MAGSPRLLEQQARGLVINTSPLTTQFPCLAGATRPAKRRRTHALRDGRFRTGRALVSCRLATIDGFGNRLRDLVHRPAATQVCVLGANRSHIAQSHTGAARP